MELSYPTLLGSPTSTGLPLVNGVMLLLHCLIGLVAAQLAQRKGRRLGPWFVWGMVGGTLALITALRCASVGDR